jgi:prolyl-tRNA synthetase
VWPWSIAPAHVLVLPVNPKQAAVRDTAERLYRDLGAAGFETILDDRDERPGVKFKDADLLGVPVRVTVGNALAKEGVVEIKERRAPRREQRVAPDAVVEAIRRLDTVGTDRR